MESILSTSGHLIPKIKQCDAVNSGFAVIPFQISRCRLRFRPPRFTASSKKSSFQDFQDYVKPRRLLPTKGLISFEDESPDKFISILQSGESQSLYKVLLRTSSNYGSGLTDLNVGVLICIIDEHGDSILERIPAFRCQHLIQHSEESVAFDRGSTDEFMWCGPKMGRIQAMWISLESGNWRLGGASLTTINVCNDQPEEPTANGNLHSSITYKFEVEDVLLGEGSEMAMAELRPCQVTEYSGVDSFPSQDKDATSLAEMRMTNEESMREYADLKYSLLLYDSMLIFAGTSISSITGGEGTAIAFFTGGLGGFLYLLLLQRSVDTLPAPESVVMSERSNFNRLFGGVKGPLLVLAFAFSIAVIVLKRDTPDFEAALSPRDILVGMSGFLACKVAVILSAIKPMSMSLEDN